MSTDTTFYGFSVHEGLVGRLDVELRFGAAPDDERMRQLGNAWAAFDEALEVFTWTFSGAFAYASWVPRVDGQAAGLAALRSWLAEHASDVVEATLLGVSVDASLDPGPEVPGSPRPPEASLPPPQPSAAFDEGAREAYKEACAGELEALLRDASQQKIGLQITSPSPPPPPLPGWMSALGSRVQASHGCAGQLLGWISELDLEALGAPDGAFDHGGLESCFNTWFSLRSGVALLGVGEQPRRYTTDNSATVLLQVALGEAKQVWRAADTDQGFHCVAWLDERTALIRTNARLLIIDLASGEELSEVRVKSERATVAIGAQGRLVAVARSTGITLYAWQRPKLKRAAVYKHKKLWIGSAAGEEVRLRVGLCHLALTGVDDYLAPAKKKKRRS